MPETRRLTVGLLALLLLGGSAAHAAPVVSVTCDHETGLYEVGETVVFGIALTDEEEEVAEGTLQCRLTLDGVGDLGQPEAALVEGKASVEASLDEPGVIRLDVSYTNGDVKARGIGGAAFSPESIEPTQPPEDFRGWWDAEKAALAEIPIDAQVTLDEARSTDTVDVFDLSLANIGGSRVRGWFCRPKAAGKYPAILSVPGAGVGPTGPAVWRGTTSLSVNISVHDQPMQESAEFYEELNAEGGALYAYPYQGRESRDTFYFRRVFLSLVRCIDFLCSQEDWDGNNVIVNGSSQGGGSSLVAAGLDERVTGAAANVPALCYHGGILHGQASGWPGLISDPEAEAVVKTAGYFDAAHFAQFIECPVLVTVGLVDRTCPPTSVYAAYNGLPSEQKELVVYPTMGHEVPKDWGQLVNGLIQRAYVEP